MNGIFLHDSLFQWVGAFLMALLADTLRSAGVYHLMVTVGFLVMVHRGLKRQDYWPLAGYVAGCVVIHTLFVWTRTSLRPSEVHVVAIQEGFDSEESGIEGALPAELRRPVDIPTGFLAVNQAIDGVVVGMTSRVNHDFFLVPFEFTRFHAHMQAAEVTDPEVSAFVHDFVDKCYEPALVRVHHQTYGLAATDLEAMAWPGDANLRRVYPGLAYKPSEVLVPDLVARGLDTCDEAWLAVESRLEDYVRSDPVHAAELARLAGGRSGLTDIFGGTASEREAAYIERLVRETFTERADEVMDTGDQPSLFANPNGNTSTSDSIRGALMAALGSVGYVFGAATMLGVAANVSAMGPYVQGLTLMMVYALFPFALLFALWPGNAWVLAKYFGVVLWVKSWTLGWAILSNFDTYQATLGTMDEAMSGLFGWTLYPVAICIAYVAVPVLCGLVLSWGTSALGTLAAGGLHASRAGTGAQATVTRMASA
ncbi:MAG: conjugal transfer protein TraG N-terminal domain-containing protein [Planctomycetes bacterium]|nr:conjugal transfer protein TraG N-terminal domain-containing protein [Planctomycetota bacterium]